MPAGKAFAVELVVLFFLSTAFAADDRTSLPAQQGGHARCPDLSGVWLTNSLDHSPPHFIIWSKAVVTASQFSITGYLGVKKPWTGTFALGKDGSQNIDIQTGLFDMSERGLSQVYEPASVHGIYKLDHSSDGDRLTMCIGINGASRPTEFVAKTNNRLIVLQKTRSDFAFPKSVDVTVLDPSGHPAAGADIFYYMSFNYPTISKDNGKTFFIDEKSPKSWMYSDIAKTRADGKARLDYSDFENAVADPGGARDPVHHWIGFSSISPAALQHGTLTIRMQPQRIVRGTILCKSLARAGKAVPWRYAYLFPYDNRIAWCMADDGAFAFPVPPGQYRLYAYGNDMEGVEEQITVPAGEGDYVLPPVSLKASKILELVGQPPPPLRGVLAWKNGSFDPASFKGKLVLIDFWGYWCGNCVVDMPKLMRAYDKFKDRGLVVLSVHVDSDGEVDTVEKLDQKTEMYRNGIWNGRDVPFPTAVVSGRSRADGGCAASADYGVQSYPTTVAIGRDGKILGDLGDQVGSSVDSDETEFDQGIEKLLAGK